jgi:hypothetical protein
MLEVHSRSGAGMNQRASFSERLAVWIIAAIVSWGVVLLAVMGFLMLMEKI